MAQANLVSTSSEINFPFVVAKVSELKSIRSPEVMIHGSPWCFVFQKLNQWLVMCLERVEKNTNTKLPYAAKATIKMLSFSPNVQPLEYHIEPQVFDYSKDPFDKKLVRTVDLSKIDKSYMKDDTIQMDIKIEVADANNVNESDVTCVNTFKSRTKSFYRLAVNNIKNLLAVRTPEFELHDYGPFDLTVFKSHSGHLEVRLQKKSFMRTNFEIVMSSQLIAPSKVAAMKQTQTGHFPYQGTLSTQDLVSWDNLLKPHNGFITSDAVVIEVGFITKWTPNAPCTANPKKT